MMRRPTIEQIEELERNVQLDPSDSYLISYPEFVRFFANISQIDKHHLIVAANFTYGWMPTVLHFKSARFEEVLDLLNQAKNYGRLNRDQVKVVADLINNSLVGASKLLHFIRPDTYAIWDSKICRYMLGRAHQYMVNDLENYFAYSERCDDLVSDERFGPVQRAVEKKLGYSVSAYRALELVLFYAGDRVVGD